MKDWILRQAKQASTWKGFALAATALGVSVSPEQINAIVSAGLAIAGLIDVMVDEDK